MKKFPSLKIEFVYSTDPNRREKIIGFEKDKYQILITTTILERGVTFADIDVYVLDSNNPLYNVASLVQIAGRVGRKKEFQNGKVIFYHQEITQEMIFAKEQIIEMNSKF